MQLVFVTMVDDETARTIEAVVRVAAAPGDAAVRGISLAWPWMLDRSTACRASGLIVSGELTGLRRRAAKAERDPREVECQSWMARSSFGECM